MKRKLSFGKIDGAKTNTTLKTDTLKPCTIDYDSVHHVGCELSGNITLNPYNFCKQNLDRDTLVCWNPLLILNESHSKMCSAF